MLLITLATVLLCQCVPVGSGSVTVRQCEQHQGPATEAAKLNLSHQINSIIYSCACDKSKCLMWKMITTCPSNIYVFTLSLTNAKMLINENIHKYMHIFICL